MSCLVLVLLLMLMMRKLDWNPRQETYSPYIYTTRQQLYGELTYMFPRTGGVYNGPVESASYPHVPTTSASSYQASVPFADHGIPSDRTGENKKIHGPSQPCPKMTERISKKGMSLTQAQSAVHAGTRESKRRKRRNKTPARHVVSDVMVGHLLAGPGIRL